MYKNHPLQIKNPQKISAKKKNASKYKVFPQPKKHLTIKKLPSTKNNKTFQLERSNRPYPVVPLISGSDQWQQHRRLVPIFEVTGGVFHPQKKRRPLSGEVKTRIQKTFSQYIWSYLIWSVEAGFFGALPNIFQHPLCRSRLAHLHRCHRTATQDEPWQVCGRYLDRYGACLSLPLRLTT